MQFAICRNLCVIILSNGLYELLSQNDWEEDRMFIYALDEYIEP